MKIKNILLAVVFIAVVGLNGFPTEAKGAPLKNVMTEPISGSSITSGYPVKVAWINTELRPGERLVLTAQPLSNINVGLIVIGTSTCRSGSMVWWTTGIAADQYAVTIYVQDRSGAFVRSLNTAVVNVYNP